MSDLSIRGAALLDGAMPEYITEHFARSLRPWHPQNDPEGYIGLCVAENVGVWDLLRPQVQRERRVEARRFGYDSMRGALSFRQRLAEFLGQRLAGRSIDPEHIAALSGAGSVLEILFYCIADPGDAVLVPTPSYAGFWADLETRNQLHIVPVHTASADGFALTVEGLERAWSESSRPVRAVLLTNPDNPRGVVLSPDELESMIAWGEARGLHVIVDELYAFSVFGPQRFRSVLTTRPSLGPKLHMVWAFSKDFAASGLRCGVLVSENGAVMQAVDALSYWGCCSGDTQFLLESLLEDEAWLSNYLEVMPQRLEASYQRARDGFARIGLNGLEAEAGFFFLVDARHLLPEPTPEAERTWWQRVLRQTNVNLTPGSACRIGEPGFFRVCHAAQHPAALREALNRLEEFLKHPANAASA